ncbi:50S ribosomal protein L24 [Pseudenhygromyxa sp. WMMC2535]|uniref:50S ribosomal protein L24 n=1 Tax=Pseudenhygromyxa sp. WMMC2535 TaxID=2712867 RepID=UPI001556F63C|nr:50S ribosomal protein L24 [Pseudenhygromyxa sp. WMMC2535]NVB36811.1 50S ribosomal protein L24 [Pseudenhygromyxa sp. WMMC2535]
MQKIRKGDEVVVITGKNKGKRGTVLRVLPSSERVLVQGINVITKHVKPTRQNQRGGLEKREAPIHISNVMIADPQSGEPTRVRIQTLEGGRKVRVAVKSGEQIDS